VPTGPDPSLSLPTTLAAAPGTASGWWPVNIDTAKPDGSTGATEAILALKYDPKVFTVSVSDVQVGSLSQGWHLTTLVNAQTGEIGIDVFSNTPIQTTDGGSLVTITMHVRDTAPAGATGLTLVNQVNPNGQRVFTTTVADNQGAFILHPAETATGVQPGTPGMVTVGAMVSGPGRRGKRPVGSGQCQQFCRPGGRPQSGTGGLLPRASLWRLAADDAPGCTDCPTGRGGLDIETTTEHTSTVQDKVLQQPLESMQQDWVSAELLEHIGQGDHSTDVDLSGVEGFFAQEGKESNL